MKSQAKYQYRPQRQVVLFLKALGFSLKQGVPLAGRQGTAMIIALMMISAVGTLIFGSARLFLANAKLVSQYEDVNSAYYSAESGIELGLLDWQKSSFTEGSLNSYPLSIGSNPLTQKTEYKIKTKGSEFHLNNLKQNLMAEIAINNLATISIRWNNDSSSSSSGKARAELIIYNNDGKRIVNPNILLNSSQNSVNIPSANAGKLRIIARDNDINNLKITPVAPTGAQIGTGEVVIDSYGVSYGQANKRRLKMKIEKLPDLNVGGAYTLFDYLLYSGDTLD